MTDDAGRRADAAPVDQQLLLDAAAVAAARRTLDTLLERVAAEPFDDADARAGLRMFLGTPLSRAAAAWRRLQRTTVGPAGQLVAVDEAAPAGECRTRPGARIAAPDGRSSC
jgi:hypothetical protein